MDTKQLLTALGKLSIQILFIKMYIPELEKHLKENRIEMNEYTLEIFEENIYVTGTFKTDISEHKLGPLREKLAIFFPHSRSNCGIRGFSIEIK